MVKKEEIKYESIISFLAVATVLSMLSFAIIGVSASEENLNDGIYKIE